MSYRRAALIVRLSCAAVMTALFILAAFAVDKWDFYQSGIVFVGAGCWALGVLLTPPQHRTARQRKEDEALGRVTP